MCAGGDYLACCGRQQEAAESWVPTGEGPVWRASGLATMGCAASPSPGGLGGLQTGAAAVRLAASFDHSPASPPPRPRVPESRSCIVPSVHSRGRSGRSSQLTDELLFCGASQTQTTPHPHPHPPHRNHRAPVVAADEGCCQTAPSCSKFRPRIQLVSPPTFRSGHFPHTTRDTSGRIASSRRGCSHRTGTAPPPTTQTTPGPTTAPTSLRGQTRATSPSSWPTRIRCVSGLMTRSTTRS